MGYGRQDKRPKECANKETKSMHGFEELKTGRSLNFSLEKMSVSRGIAMRWDGVGRELRRER